MAAGDASIKSNIYYEFEEATGRTYKLTEYTNDVLISDPDLDVGETYKIDVDTI